MAGRPLMQINRTVQALLDATQGGRDDEAKSLMARLTRICGEAGIPRPELPEEVMELAASWQASVHNSPNLPAVPGTDLDMDTRHVLIDVGQKAARRMQQMIDDDSAWGPGGWIEPRKQADTLHLMLGRAYGVMPSGARFLRLPDGTTGDRQQTPEGDERMQVETIGLMVSRRVRNGRDSEGAESEEGTQRSAQGVSAGVGGYLIDEAEEVSAHTHAGTPLHTAAGSSADEKSMSSVKIIDTPTLTLPIRRRRRLPT